MKNEILNYKVKRCIRDTILSSTGTYVQDCGLSGDYLHVCRITFGAVSGSVGEK